MDHYSTLGVAKNATPDEIKKAYRKLASQHHPDRGGDTATFQKIQQAYDILSDPDKKQQYDNPQPQGFPGGFSFNMNGGDIHDIFAQMFGGGHHPFHQQRRNFQQTYRTQVFVTLDDSYNGASQSIKLQLPTGIKVLNLDIPKGVDNGMQMRYDNIIENGVLIVEFVVVPHLRYERRGNDLYANQSISVLDLIVGTKFDFKTISGKVLEVSVKPKTQPYIQLKLPGQGMPVPNTGHYGDQIILLKPFIPDNIDESILEAISKVSQNK